MSEQVFEEQTLEGTSEVHQLLSQRIDAAYINQSYLSRFWENHPTRI